MNVSASAVIFELAFDPALHAGHLTPTDLTGATLVTQLIRPLIKEAEEEKQIFIFIILDKKDEKDSILNIKSTNYQYINGQLELEIKHYLEEFPFKYYIIVKVPSPL